jgi:hypothetical protein
MYRPIYTNMVELTKVIMQQWYSDNSYLMHISRDCNKDLQILEKGLCWVVEKVTFHNKIQKLNLAPTPLVDGPSSKLDQHEHSHSRALHVINDALLNMMECMT